MPENIFKQVALDILRLHQRTARSLFAAQGGQDCKIYDAPYAALDGRYYIALPDCACHSPKNCILLIEDEAAQSRLSWVAETRRIKPHCNLYYRALSVLQRKMRRCDAWFDGECSLFELTPKKGRLTAGVHDLPLSPHDLEKALYPQRILQQPF